MPSAVEHRPITVLVVEDEFLIRADIADRLKEAGFSVYDAESADAAIRILETRSDIHLVFTDIDMPGSMDGLKLPTCVRNRWPPIKLIVTSGHVSPAEGILPEGGRFFPKPYEVGAISRAIVELIALEANLIR